MNLQEHALCPLRYEKGSDFFVILKKNSSNPVQYQFTAIMGGEHRQKQG